MRILQVANGYLGNRLYKNLFSTLKGVGVDNVVYVPVDRRQTVPARLEPEVIVSNCFSTPDRITFWRKQRKILRDIEARVELASVSMVHAHTVFSGGYAARQIQKKYGLPYIVAVRNTDVNVFFKYMIHLRGTGLDILRHAERIIFLSPAYQENVLANHVAARYREDIRQKSLVIPNGIASLFFENRSTPKTLTTVPIRLIYVGEVSSNKNLEETIQAIELLREKGRNVSLTVVGAILDERYRIMLNSSNFIEYHDRCPQEEVLTYLKSADIFVMPSHQETFGLVYAEAMSQALPVLYTRGQGFDGQFPDGTVGYAVSDNDPQELADKLEQVMENYDQLSANCVSQVNKFNWDSIARQYKDIYQAIISDDYRR